MSPLRVCIATPDIVGPIRNGGIGTAYYNLALVLAAAGHRVTIRYLPERELPAEEVARWRRWYAERGGVAFESMPVPERPRVMAPKFRARSFRAYRWLAQADGAFDIIHFPEWGGCGYFAVLAKHLGLNFRSTAFCVGAHSPSMWHALASHQAVAAPTLLDVAFLEREQVRLADVLVSPSRYMLDWMRGQDWRLPSMALVRPNAMLPEEEPAAGLPGLGATQIRELVFFGRLEERKGLVLFCEAVDRLLASPGPRPERVTFLGKPGRVGPRRAELFLAERAARWDVPHVLVADRDRAGAQAYLREPGRLAVIPSLEDNSPYTVLECLAARIPFVAAAVGGVPELVAEADRERVCFAPRAPALAATLAAALAGEGLRPGACAFDLQDNNRGWVALHEGELAALAAAGGRGRPHPTEASLAVASPPSPLVSVCVVHHDRPALLAQALASLRAQDYPSLEVILVDDGSPGEEARRHLDSLEPEFAGRGWAIVRQENRYPGAARNNAARHARGEYLLFMDDDNVARADEVRRLVEVARTTDADILTCVSQPFRGAEPPDTSRAGEAMWVPSGADVALGMFENCFGDVNALVRRRAFEELGGFSEDYRVGHEDWEFYARAVLRGYALHVVPLPLFWYRVSDAGIQRSSNVRANYARSLRPYLDAVPPGLRDALRLAQGLCLTLHPPQPLGDLPPSPVAELKAIKRSVAWRLAKPVLALEGRIRGNPRRRPRRP